MLHNKPGIYLIKPQNYLPFLELIRNCNLIISDSGGLQEEAPTFGKRILITRLTTERPEVIESGFGYLVGYDSQMIIEQALAKIVGITELNLASNPFGNGDSAAIIQRSISEFLVNSI
jgi:UDP-N-acetylglucosamine 2-epimerase